MTTISSFRSTAGAALVSAEVVLVRSLRSDMVLSLMVVVAGMFPGHRVLVLTDAGGRLLRSPREYPLFGGHSSDARTNGLRLPRKLRFVSFLLDRVRYIRIRSINTRLNQTSSLPI